MPAPTEHRILTTATHHNPVAIGGVGGSGTGVVARIVEKMGVYLGRDLNRSHDNLSYTFLFRRPDLVTVSDSAFRHQYRIFDKVMSGGGPLSAAEQLTIQELISAGVANDVGSKQYEWRTQRARHLQEEAASETKHAIWGWKEPNTHIFLDRIYRLQPGLKYIHVVRNGLDVATSANQRQRARWSRYILNRGFSDTPREALKYWCAVQKRVETITGKQTQGYLLVNFDDLCGSAQTVIRSIAAFIGLNLTDAEIAELATHVRQPTSRGRYEFLSSQEFDPDDIATVARYGFNIDQQWLARAQSDTNHADPKMLLLQSALFANKGQGGKALKVCGRAREIAPDNPRVCRRLGELMVEYGDVDAGVRLLGHALQLDHQKGNENFDAHIRMAQTLVDAEKHDQAIAVCRQLLDLPGQKSPHQAKQVMRMLARAGAPPALARAAAMPNLSRRLVPTFLIIGAQRSGTSYLHRCIRSHPDVNFPKKKELHFFDNKYVKGIDWYLAQFPTQATAKEITGEATPYYLYHPLCAARIKEHFPQMKFIVILRNPAERAFSHYKWSTKKGNEPLNFEHALDAEEERLKRQFDLLKLGNAQSFNHQKYSYRNRGLYVEQIERWLALFRREQFRFLRSEDLFENPNACMAGLWGFLGLSDHTVIDSEPVKSSSDQLIDPEIRRELEAYYRPYNKRLSALLNIRFNW